MNFDFSGVEVAEGRVSKFAEPGFQKLTITGLVPATAASGSTGVELSFTTDKGTEFKQKWWFANANKEPLRGALPSFQYLVKAFTGETLGAGVSIDSLAAKLVGKSTEATVGGRRYTTVKDGVKYDNVAAMLPFADWAGDVKIQYSGEWDKSDLGPLDITTDKSDGLPF